MLRTLMAMAAVATMLAVATPPLHAEDTAEKPTVQVSATGWVEKAPEVATVVLGVETSAKTAKEASRENATLMTQVIKAIERAGVAKDKMRSVSFYVSPRYPVEPRRSRMEPEGYMASNSLEVTVDPLDKAGDVIDAAIAAGANRTNQLSFDLRDPEAAQLEALADAIRRAKEQAKVLAAADSKHVGAILRASTSGGGPQPPFYRMQAMKSMAEDAATPIEGGPVRVMASVDVTYLLTASNEDR